MKKTLHNFRVMKKLIPIASIVVLIVIAMVACNHNSAKDTKTLTFTDTVGLAQFQAWKTQNELKDPNLYYNQAGANEAIEPVNKGVTKTTTRKTSGSTANKTWSKTSESAYPAKPVVQKKGWSKAAKGAAIGGGSGAVIGAVINKRNRVVGGVIGGVVGGAIGYGIGRHLDKKDGRYLVSSQ